MSHPILLEAPQIVANAIKRGWISRHRSQPVDIANLKKGFRVFTAEHKANLAKARRAVFLKRQSSI
jgi:hypothetical protein